MRFQIREIVLWPRRPETQPRRLPFTPGAVNVITGASKTGKSAIIPIIDYCLGSGRCAIPVGVIRDTCEWFGVVVEVEGGQKLLARREPGQQRATGDMFLLEGRHVEIPDAIERKNTTVEAVKELLNDLSGLTRLDFDFEATGSGFKGRPSFRDFVALVFQPQSIVANPNVLFYKADTYQHQEKLRTVFPFVLGAVTNEILAVQHQLRRLRRELQRKEREFSALRDVSRRWLAEARSKIAQARELGLLKEAVPESLEIQDLVELLRSLVASGVPELEVSAASVRDAAEELLALKREEADVSRELATLRQRFGEMSRLRETASHYRDAISIKRDRLKISEWVRQLHDEDHECPLCGSTHGVTGDQLDALSAALRDAEEQVGEFSNIPPAFEREFERIQQELQQCSERLEAVQIRRRALEDVSEELRAQQYSERAAWQFIGSLEEAIKRYDALKEDGDLVAELEALGRQVAELEARVAEKNIKAATRRALSRVQLLASRILPALDVERPDDPFELSIEDLTVRIVGAARTDYLWEIGSGANWLSYHVAVTQALQQLFLEQRQSPVPSFVVYDQPSQVYFPWRLGAGPEDPEFKDEDVEAVRKVFTVLGQVSKAVDGQLQTIVLDHAPEEVWGGLPGVRLVEEWRRGKTLVPLDWIGV